ncbi:energy transducer TonB [Thermomonas sp. HDW16]|uniref:energy transducer TonB n=1 Tax=Thermomonas sp. HDW16 TaxID=2714945 RepID=UPI00140BEC55|nr:energy transducer TonB [Thermomonas sp. HDW16]QIL20245.1 energy transducer TonB [Thermomonas sp. HDW16]
MVRAHALPHSSGFALLKPASKPQLDSARILTLSGTIALNVLAMGLLMMPLSMPSPITLPDEKPRDQTRWIPREQPKPETVEIVKDKPKPSVTHPIQQRAATQKPAETTNSEIIASSGTEFVAETATDTAGPAESISAIEAAPSPMQLQYRMAPAPTYPRRALLQHLTGTVLLEVLVGIDGRPLEVKVAQSSGYRELDEAARAQVLKRWSFQPATKNGLAVQAIGMVPIEFALKN